jgi:hypothetical protein
MENISFSNNLILGFRYIITFVKSNDFTTLTHVMFRYSRYSDWTCDGVKKCYDIGVVINHYNGAGYTRGTITADDLKEKSTDVVDVACNNPATGKFWFK